MIAQCSILNGFLIMPALGSKNSLEEDSENVRDEGRVEHFRKLLSRQAMAVAFLTS